MHLKVVEASDNTDPLPTILLTADDLWEIHCAFACERLALERSFLRSRYSYTEMDIPSFRFNDSGQIEDSAYHDYRFQRRILALNSALWGYINATIGTCTGTILKSGDFFHCLRVMLDRVAPPTPPSTFLTLIQSHTFVQAVTKRRRVVLRLKNPVS